MDEKRIEREHKGSEEGRARPGRHGEECGHAARERAPEAAEEEASEEWIVGLRLREYDEGLGKRKLIPEQEGVSMGEPRRRVAAVKGWIGEGEGRAHRGREDEGEADKEAALLVGRGARMSFSHGFGCYAFLYACRREGKANRLIQ